MARIPVLMPKLGLTMAEAEIVEWKVAPGDRVQAGQVIFVIETDKSANDVEALDSGTVEALLANAGDTVEVGATVAMLIAD